AIVADGSLSSPVFSSIKVVYQQGALPADYSDPSGVKNIGYGIGEVSVEGFENSTTENGGIYYQVDYGIKDSAGVLAFCGQNPGGVNQVGYPITNAFATDIQGFLRE